MPSKALTKIVNPLLVVAISWLSIYSAGASAALVNTQEVLSNQQFLVDKQQMIELVNSDELKEQLKSYGITSEMAEERIKIMTPDELAAFNAALENDPAGGSLLGAAVLIFVVFIFTDMMCATDLFTFVDCINK